MKKEMTRQQKANALLKLVEGCAKNMDKVPTAALVQSLNSTIDLLAKRGIKIRDFDDREKVVHSFKCLGKSVFILAPRNDPGTEGDADGKDGNPGGK